jgi:hypothetical protein
MTEFALAIGWINTLEGDHWRSSGDEHRRADCAVRLEHALQHGWWFLRKAFVHYSAFKYVLVANAQNGLLDPIGQRLR